MPQQTTNPPIILKKHQKYLKKGTHLPPGKIMKRYTGIGATQLEIDDNSRNSFIVVPTRALAATKVIAARERLDNIKYAIFYVGSDYMGLEKADFHTIKDAFLEDKIVKVIAVADSFLKLYNEDQQFFRKNFHLMFDEADAYQSESNYRIVMEDCMLAYFDFPKKKRTLISATLQESLYKPLIKEPLTEIKRVEDTFNGLNLINVKGDVVLAAVEHIKKIIWKDRGIKLLIAFNSINGITNVIYGLKKYKKEIAVLCSEASKLNPKISRYYDELEDGHLPNKINFITAAYFAGVDILEKTNTTIIVDTSVSHTVLTKAKIFQIFGRSREGCTNRTLIFNTSHNKFNKGLLKRLKRKAESDQKHFEEYVSKVSYKEIIPSDGRIESWIDDFRKENRYPNSLVRARHGKILINYMLIDYYFHMMESLGKLYTGLEGANKVLSELFKINNSQIIQSVDKIVRQDQYRLEKEIEKRKTARRTIKSFRHDPYSISLIGMFDNFQYYMIRTLKLEFPSEQQRRIISWLGKQIDAYNYKTLKKCYEGLRPLSKLHEIGDESVFLHFLKEKSTYSEEEIITNLQAFVNQSNIDIFPLSAKDLNNFETAKKMLKNFCFIRDQRANNQRVNIIRLRKVEDFLK